MSGSGSSLFYGALHHSHRSTNIASSLTATLAGCVSPSYPDVYNRLQSFSSPSWCEEALPTTSSTTSLVSHTIKEEEPDSPQIIIEPLLSSSLALKRPSSSSPESSLQVELETQLLLSQALAPPTEVPLRATQACDDMRQMMRSFRLNPFSILSSNGKGLSQDVNHLGLTWCGEVPRPLDEEPMIFEWQLEGYIGDVDELSELFAFDEEECADESSDGVPENLEDPDQREEAPEPSMIFSSSSSSLSLSDHARCSGFSASAQTLDVLLGRSAPQRPDVNNEQRAGSNDSGYESNPTPSISKSRNFLDGFPYKKPRLDIPQLSRHSARRENGFDAALHSRSSPAYLDRSLCNNKYMPIRKPEIPEKFAVPRHPTTPSTFARLTRDRVSESNYGDMYSTAPLRTSAARSPTLLPFSSLPSTQEFLNVARIWESAANSDGNLCVSDPIDTSFSFLRSHSNRDAMSSINPNSELTAHTKSCHPYPSSTTSASSRLVQGVSSSSHTFLPALSRPMAMARNENGMLVNSHPFSNVPPDPYSIPIQYHSQDHSQDRQEFTAQDPCTMSPHPVFFDDSLDAPRTRGFLIDHTDAFDQDIYANSGSHRSTTTMGYSRF